MNGALLHMRWDEYVEMFGKSQDEFEIMNAVAPGFFKNVQDMSWEHLLLHLCRFADPARVGHRRTLSLDAIAKLPESKVVPHLTRLVETAQAKIKFAQDWRHRAIAHADLEHMLDRNVSPLASASRANIKEALRAIVAVLEAIEMHFTQSRLGFGGPRWNWGGVQLLRDLQLAAKLRKERDERIAAGLETADDLDYEKWR